LLWESIQEIMPSTLTVARSLGIIDFEAFISGNWDSERVKHYTPYLDGDKFTILEDGLKCCEQLGFDFDEFISALIPLISLWFI
jgi:hypothetical protein